MLLQIAMGAMGAAQAGLGAWQKKREEDKFNDRINRLLKETRADANANEANAYGRATSFLMANRNNPNAWNFASNLYGETVSRNEQNVNSMKQMKAQAPISNNNWLTDSIMGGAETGLFSALSGWDTKRNNILGVSKQSGSSGSVFDQFIKKDNVFSGGF